MAAAAPVSGPVGDVIVVAVAVSFLGAGIVAWRVRPRNRVAPLLVAVGLLWTLARLPLPLPGELDAVLGGAWAAALAHVVVAFPTGRLDGPAARAVVGLAYLSVLAAGLLQSSASAAAPAAGAAGAVLSGLAVLALQLARWRRSTVAQRRAVGPVLAAAVVATALFVAVKPVLGAGILVQYLTPVMHLALAAIPLACLASILRRRIDRGGVADLVVRLSDAPRPVGIQGALARALHDPTLRVGYWVPESGGYVDVDGRAVPSHEDGDRAVTRIDRNGDPLAVLVHDPVLLDDPELIEATCAAAALALANERLTADLRLRVRQLAESRGHVLRAAEAERRRLERDLHDGVQQRLLSIPMTLSLAESALRDGPDRVRSLIGEARTITLAVLEELRALSQGVHPPVLTERGLAGAVRELAAVAPVPLDLSLRLPARLPPEVESTAYYVVAEAMANITKHARAGQAWVRIEHRAGRLTVEIRDDGRGGADPALGSGLRGLADRVAAGAGTLQVHSPSGRGTRIRAVLPCG